MICTHKEQSERIFEWVQTILNIEYENNLEIISVEPFEHGFKIIYREYCYGNWSTDNLTLFNSQILLIETFRK